MNDDDRTIEQLRDELDKACRRIGELEESLRQTRAALEEMEEMRHTQASLSDEIYFSYDNQLNVRSVSENVERIVGYKPEDLVGRSFEDLRAIVHPEDQEDAIENATHVLSGKTVYPNIYRFFTTDGLKKFAEVDGVPIIKDGKVAAMVSRAKDITGHVELERSLRESEGKLLAVIENLPDAVCILGLEDFRHIYVNRGFCRMTGYTAAETLGRTPVELALPVGLDDCESLWEGAAGAKGVHRLEYQIRRRDGSIVDVLVYCGQVRYGITDCILMVMTDISAFKHTEEEKKKIDIMLLQNQKMDAIRTLSTGIAHDFNNILTAVIGYTKLALRDAAELVGDRAEFSVVRSDLNEVRKAALKARDLVNQLLAFGRHAQKTYSPLVLSAAVRDSLKILRPLLNPNIEVHENLDDGGIVLADPILIHQAFMNLCTNAVNALGEHGGTLEIGVENVTVDEGHLGIDPDLPPGPYVKLTVHDTGGGMDMRVKPRIFDPYFTTRWKGRGAGLGLSVVHGIVKDHGGSIVCTSSPGGGTLFDLFFPEIVSEKDEIDALVDMANAKGNERILIIDDEPALVTQANKTLENLGYSVVAKTNGTEGLEHFRKNPHRYDLVITDMTMSGMTGDTLATRLTEIRSDIPIIIFSKFDHPLSKEGPHRGKNRECIMKPVEMRGLAKAVRKVLDREQYISTED